MSNPVAIKERTRKAIQPGKFCDNCFNSVVHHLHKTRWSRSRAFILLTIY